jgi:hypothetical protein
MRLISVVMPGFVLAGLYQIGKRLAQHAPPSKDIEMTRNKVGE